MGQVGVVGQWVRIECVYVDDIRARVGSYTGKCRLTVEGDMVDPGTKRVLGVVGPYCG
jgi:hypothetical protein